MAMTEDDREFIDQGKTILNQEWLGSYEEEQTKMFLGLILTKYEQLVGSGTEEQVDPDYTTAVIAELVADSEIGDRAQTILRDVVTRRPDPTAADLAATPTEPGIYLDRLGNTWHRYQDGVFAMSSRIRASAAFYAPFKRLEVVEGRPAAGVPTSPEREKLIEKLKVLAHPYVNLHISDDTKRTIEQAASALAAPVAVDKAKLAEVLSLHFPKYQQCGGCDATWHSGRSFRDHQADVVAEWLGGGER